MDYQCLLNSSILLGDPGTLGRHYQPYGLKGIGRPYSRSHRVMSNERAGETWGSWIYGTWKPDLDSTWPELFSRISVDETEF